MPGPVIVLGATSQIARDFIVHAHRRHGVDFALFARRPDAVRAFMSRHALPDGWIVGALSELAKTKLYAATGIINFVGVGDPAKAKDMGADIFGATLDSDALARTFITARPGTPYVFCSSGAVYGSGFAEPAGPGTPSVIPVNALEPQHFYTIAKLHAEAMHRASAKDTILDLRIFNYFSRTQDIAARFLINDMLRCVAEGRVFETTDAAVTRDYIAPQDLCALMLTLLAVPAGTNVPVDAYSLAPITKAELLDLFQQEFGLKVQTRPQVLVLNATGAKPHYYSRNRAAEVFGYRPTHTSAQSVLEEGRAMLDRIRA